MSRSPNQSKNIIRPMGVGLGLGAGGPPLDVFPLEAPAPSATTPPHEDYEEDYEEEEEEDALK